MEVGHANTADAEALRELHVTTWAATYSGRVPDVFYRDELAAHHVRDWTDIVRRQTALGGGVLTARSGPHLVGLCQYGPTEDEDGDPAHVGHIHRLYVHPGHQRAGVGRALLTEATDRLRHSGKSVATLWVLESDARARAFYERLGWQADGGRKAHPAIDLRYRRSLV